jgi:hypothetical protein
VPGLGLEFSKVWDLGGGAPGPIRVKQREPLQVLPSHRRQLKGPHSTPLLLNERDRRDNATLVSPPLLRSTGFPVGQVPEPHLGCPRSDGLPIGQRQVLAGSSSGRRSEAGDRSVSRARARGRLGSSMLCLLTAVIYLPLVPLVFRYSRVLYMHMDRKLDPDVDETTL